MKTTEFWQTVFANVVALLVSTGVLTPEVADEWAGILGPVLMAVVTAVYSYTRMRAKVAGSGAELETLRALTDRFDRTGPRDKGFPPVPEGVRPPPTPPLRRAQPSEASVEKQLRELLGVVHRLEKLAEPTTVPVADPRRDWERSFTHVNPEPTSKPPISDGDAGTGRD